MRGKEQMFNPRRHRPFRIFPRHKGDDPLAVSPLIELELRGKNERVARRETKRLIQNRNEGEWTKSILRMEISTGPDREAVL